MSDWNPNLYRRFEGERTRPAMDLLSRVGIDDPKRVVDLGCGPGNSTEILRARYRDAAIVAVDNSPAMVDAGRVRVPSATFELGDAGAWSPEQPVDLMFANAVFHWLPDHASLLPRLATRIAPGGCLAFQVPDNLSEPSHLLMREAAVAIGKADIVPAAEAERATIGTFDDYWAWLAPHFAHVELWRTTYVHPLESHDAVVTWLEATGLRPYLARLAEGDAKAFRAKYREDIARAYKVTNGRVLLQFPRLFAVARAAA